VHAGGGVNHFIVYARQAILGGRLTPHENRTIPPLRPEVVYRLVEAFPSIRFTLNGGVETYEDAQEHVENGVAGVMVGRAVVNNPWYWRQVDSKVYGNNDPIVTRRQVLLDYGAYARGIEQQQGRRARASLLKPVTSLFAGEPNGKRFRNQLDTLLKQSRDRDRAIGVARSGSVGGSGSEVLDDIGLLMMRAAEVLEADTLDCY